MFQHLLVPLAGDELSPRAMKASVELARKLGAAVTGFIAEPTAAPIATGHSAASAMQAVEDQRLLAAAHAQDLMASFAATAAAAGVPFQAFHTSIQPVGTAIVEAAHRLGCDLIVMVTHGRGRVGRLLYGSRTQDVLARSDIPVLILR
ncbi:universal stress protein [Caldimonas brevitalea]|uniref:UspA domain-containing protein n=1 Tax=Caldimonas brevitalea TaxID=413882 RepID=A0A0G3BPN6_9BURK|nr:universal stress protein [Caldimonas brevitalea]AKJ31372.1 hypothetical protein AAW51_4681 [Caldimonas brevitalea]